MVVSSAYREINQIYPEPGWVEHNPMEYWDTTLICAKEALNKAGIKPSQIAGIGITDQRETTIIWDKKTGEQFIMPLFGNVAGRLPFVRTLKQKGLEGKIRQKTGLTIDAYFSLPK